MKPITSFVQTARPADKAQGDASAGAIWPWVLAAAAVMALAGLGLFLQGSAASVERGSSDRAPLRTGQDAAHAAGASEMSSMLDRLALRLQAQPDDVQGWAMLARSYTVLERHPLALAAFQKAVALSPNDAVLIADYANSLAMNQGSLSGSPLQQVERALALDAHNLKALFLAGAEAMDRRDNAAAVKYWEQLVRFGPVENPLVQQVLPALAQVRQLAGLPAGSPSESRPVNAAGTVSGLVTLAPALAKGVSPEDTVFIFARAVQAEGAPLAVLRRQVKDLPLQFMLDDSMGMSAQNPLSAAPQVIVSALLSKSGQAMAQSGDLLGQSAPARVGASGLAIEIRERVR
jgi:cytochrome c-type biogenesis protein CcmH